MSGLLHKIENMMGGHKSTSDSSDGPPLTPLEKEAQGNTRVVASGGTYDAGPGVGDETTVADTTAPTAGSSHKGDNYDAGDREGKGRNTTEEIADESHRGPAITDETRPREQEYTSGRTEEYSSGATRGGDVFATDPTSARGNTGGYTTETVVAPTSTTYETGATDNYITDASRFQGEITGGQKGSLLAALHGEKKSILEEYGGAGAGASSGTTGITETTGTSGYTGTSGTTGSSGYTGTSSTGGSSTNY